MLNRDEVFDWCVISFILPMMLILSTLIFITGTGTAIGSYMLSVIEAPLIFVQLYFGFRILARKGKFVVLKFLILIPIYYITVESYFLFAINYGAGIVV